MRAEFDALFSDIDIIYLRTFLGQLQRQAADEIVPLKETNERILLLAATDKYN